MIYMQHHLERTSLLHWHRQELFDIMAWALDWEFPGNQMDDCLYCSIAGPTWQQ